MKNTYNTLWLKVLIICILTTPSFGQISLKYKQLKKESQISTRFSEATRSQTYSTTPPSSNNSTQSFFDVRFAFDPFEGSGSRQLLGVCYIKGYFYFSRWAPATNNDTLVIFDSTATFSTKVRINGIGSVYSMTTDGTFIYAANGTRNIQVINPITRTRVRQIIAPIGVGTGIGWITYNPQGNNGLGSFYCGDFDTNIFQLTKPTGTNATLINPSIPAARHGLEGMNGVAYDPTGAFPKFWAFDYNQRESNSVVVQLSSTGIPTGIRKDVDLDAPSGAGGSAGGIFVAQIPGYPGNTLLALVQGGGLVAYDINSPQLDAGMDSLYISTKLFAWPSRFDYNTKINGRVRSLGSTALTNLRPKTEIRDINTDDLIESFEFNPPSLRPNQSFPFQTAAINRSLYPSGTLCIVNGISNLAGDEFTSNDTLEFLFEVTDSTIARDYVFLEPSIAGRTGIGSPADDVKSLGVRFSLPADDTLTSVSYYLRSPIEGQSSSVSVYSINPQGVISTTPITTSASFTATAAHETNGVFVTIPLDSPLSLSSGDFFVAVNELGDSSLGLGISSYGYQTKTFYVKSNSITNGLWDDLQTFSSGFWQALSIYPNFGKNLIANTNKSISQSGFSISPNPSTGRFTIFMKDGNFANAQIGITNSLGQKINLPSNLKFENGRMSFDLKGQEPGVYFVSIANAGNRKTYPLVLTN